MISDIMLSDIRGDEEVVDHGMKIFLATLVCEHQQQTLTCIVYMLHWWVDLEIIKCLSMRLSPPLWWVIFSGWTGSQVIFIQSDSGMRLFALGTFISCSRSSKLSFLRLTHFFLLLSRAWKVKLLLCSFEKNVWPEGPCYVVFLLSILSEDFGKIILQILKIKSHICWWLHALTMVCS